MTLNVRCSAAATAAVAGSSWAESITWPGHVTWSTTRCACCCCSVRWTTSRGIDWWLEFQFGNRTCRPNRGFCFTLQQRPSHSRYSYTVTSNNTRTVQLVDVWLIFLSFFYILHLIHLKKCYRANKAIVLNFCSLSFYISRALFIFLPFHNPVIKFKFMTICIIRRKWCMLEIKRWKIKIITYFALLQMWLI